MALAAYNAGQGVVAAWKDGLQADGSGGEAGRANGEADQDGQDSTSGQDGTSRLSLADIRFAETREFVKRVERFRDLYTRAHPDLFVGETAQRGESGT
jgi:soluble lytic murein transglycosylase-like protein